jgi:putative (di)nucleoside polyphosphate hydrolase
VEVGEPLLTAVFREVKEEVGIVAADLTLLDEHPVFLGYELPPELQSSKTGRGQCHRWFLFRLAAGARVETATDGEFRRHQWVLLEELVAKAVAFRRPIYQELARYFAAQLRPKGEDLAKR